MQGTSGRVARLQAAQAAEENSAAPEANETKRELRRYGDWIDSRAGFGRK